MQKINFILSFVNSFFGVRERTSARVCELLILISFWLVVNFWHPLFRFKICEKLSTRYLDYKFAASQHVRITTVLKLPEQQFTTTKNCDVYVCVVFCHWHALACISHSKRTFSYINSAMMNLLSCTFLAIAFTALLHSMQVAVCFYFISVHFFSEYFLSLSLSLVHCLIRSLACALYRTCRYIILSSGLFFIFRIHSYKWFFFYEFFMSWTCLVVGNDCKPFAYGNRNGKFNINAKCKPKNALTGNRLLSIYIKLTQSLYVLVFFNSLVLGFSLKWSVWHRKGKKSH